MIHNTDIAGSPHLTDYDAAFNAAKERLNVVIEGGFRNHQVHWRETLGGHPSQCYIDFSIEATEDPRILLGLSERDYQRQWHGNAWIGHNIALLFPHHNLALITNPHWLNELPKLEERLTELGYSVVQKRKNSGLTKYYSQDWGNENAQEVFRILREPGNGVRAVDKRTEEILDKLDARINAGLYNFAVFTPQHEVGKTNPYGFGHEIVMRPVKGRADIPKTWMKERLERLCKGLPLARAVGLTSQVLVGGEEKHIPMIDFSPRVGWEGDRKIQDTLKKLSIPGMLVLSGNSYHFYGFNLLNNSEWRSYMGSLKGMDGVDCNWPDLQLHQGYSMLRLTPSTWKLSQPCFLEFFQPKLTGTDSQPVARAEKAIEKISVAA